MSPRTLAFDLSEAETIAALTKAFGRPPTERGENSECGGGSMNFADWKGELMVYFLDGRFAGWDSRGKLKTLEGVGVGSTRAEVATLSGFEVEESTLGAEFRSGGLSGVLEVQGTRRQGDPIVGRRHMRVPLAAALAVALVAAAGCSPGSAPQGNGQEARAEPASEMPLANASDSAVPAPVAAPAPAAIGLGKGRAALRLALQPNSGQLVADRLPGPVDPRQPGRRPGPGMDEMPDMSTAGWVETNGITAMAAPA